MQYVDQLEKEFSNWVGVSNPVACSSGTTALHLALEAFQFPPGSHVIVPEFTMIACARAVTMAGLVPIAVDCGDDLNIDPQKLNDLRWKENVVAIIPTAIYGRGYNIVEINHYAKTWDLKVIEDLAEYHGGKVNPFADAHCWSFYKNKIVAGEEGGLVSFFDSDKAALAKQLRCQGFTENHDFYHIPRGINGRLSNANAWLILDSLKNVELNIIKRSQICHWYNTYVPEEWQMPLRDVTWVYDIKLPSPIDVGYVVHWLNKKGIQARHAFKPISCQTEYYHPSPEVRFGLKAYEMSQRVMYLPVDPLMSEPVVEKICDWLKQAVDAQ